MLLKYNLLVLNPCINFPIDSLVNLSLQKVNKDGIIVELQKNLFQAICYQTLLNA